MDYSKHTLVSAPNFELYKFWLKQQPVINCFEFLWSDVALLDHNGPVVVLNGGSPDMHIRTRIKNFHLNQTIHLRV